ncbi:MAG: DUF4124 domain-containing protein [Thiobacillus sp.]|nr:DUF4124 domain-containing protein [Thiobacillus sp.]
MRRLIVLTALAGLVLASSAGADTLNKCIDAQGKVTYSNLPCRNAREVQKVEIDPAPLPDAAPKSIRSQSAPTQPARGQDALPVPETKRPPTGKASSKAAVKSSARECDSLSEKLGSVLDKMDKAHRKGYTQDQMDTWNQEVKTLESKKRQSGCF